MGDLEMRVGQRVVGTTTDINRVGNIERADQRGYVAPRPGFTGMGSTMLPSAPNPRFHCYP